jgi:hypothetical protein
VTTIATDGKSMAGDGRCHDHCDTLVDDAKCKVFRLPDGRIVGGSGNSFDVDSWRLWVAGGKIGDCPIESEQFAALILLTDETVLWVDHKGRETITPPPVAIGSGQDFAYGAMEAGLSAEQAVQVACRRDTRSGGKITVLQLDGA